MSQALLRRLSKLENDRPRPATFHVISNIGVNGAFLAEHGRMMTDAEMDDEEAAMRAGGVVQPNEEVDRVIITIVSPNPTGGSPLRLR